MKTFFEKLFVHFESISHPAGGWFKTQENSRKRKGGKSDFRPVPSPDSFNVRGGSKKVEAFVKHLLHKTVLNKIFTQLYL
jgi:hypothetical protein